MDGQEVNYDTLLNTFIGVTLDVGEHEIEFEYIPRGFNTGLLISILSIVLFSYSIYNDSRKIKLNNKKH